MRITLKTIVRCGSFGLLLMLAACRGWLPQPYNYNPATPVPSRTPSILTATPFILSPLPGTPPTDTVTPTLGVVTDTPAAEETLASETPTLPPPGLMSVDVLGCDTGVDVLHAMGEVTNAYVTVRNATALDVPDVCATLRGLDEARLHPDKTKCVASLPAGYEVTLKLTVDTTYKAETPIQVDVTTGETLLVRDGAPACKAIGLLLPAIGELGEVRPIP